MKGVATRDSRLRIVAAGTSGTIRICHTNSLTNLLTVCSDHRLYIPRGGAGTYNLCSDTHKSWDMSLVSHWLTKESHTILHRKSIEYGLGISSTYSIANDLSRFLVAFTLPGRKGQLYTYILRYAHAWNGIKNTLQFRTINMKRSDYNCTRPSTAVLDYYTDVDCPKLQCIFNFNFGSSVHSE